MKSERKGVFVHPCMREYRVELFKNIGDISSIDIIESSYPKSGLFVEKERHDAIIRSGLSFVSRRHRKVLGINNSDHSIFKVLSSKYNFVIFSGVLSFPFLLLCVPAKMLGKSVFVFDETIYFPRRKLFYFIKPIVRFLGNNTVNGFILASSNALSFNLSMFKSAKNRIVTLNTHKDMPSTLGTHKRSKKILYLGRVVEIKGLDLLINAVENIDISIDVYGDGDFITTCKKLVCSKNMRHRVKFFGSCDKSKVDEIMQRYEYFCLPSREMPGQNSPVESWGFTVNEALMNGLNIICSNSVGSAKDLIEDGVNGFVFKSGSIRDLSIKIGQLSSLSLSPLELQSTLLEKCNNLKNATKIVNLIESGK